VKTNICAIILPSGEKCGLAIKKQNNAKFIAQEFDRIAASVYSKREAVGNNSLQLLLLLLLIMIIIYDIIKTFTL